MTLRNTRFGQLQAAIFAVAAGYTAFQTWQLFGEWIRDEPGTLRYIGLAVCGVPTLLLAWCAVRSLQQGVTVTADGLRVRNILTTRTVRWSDIVGFVTGSTLSETPVGTKLVWWVVQVLLRDGDRMVRIHASSARNRDDAEAFAARLRSIGPSSASMITSLRPPTPVSPVPIDPATLSRRYTVRSWALGQGGPGGGQTFLGICIIIGFVVGFIVLSDGAIIAGAIIVAASVGLTGLFVLSSRPLLVVTGRGLRPDYRRLWRRTPIPWTEVYGMRVIETPNTLMNRRCCYLEATTSRGATPLWATLRPTSRFSPVGQRVLAYAPRR